jgi:folate-dependent phosphoribosylglycinamide formyltransferase PurN
MCHKVIEEIDAGEVLATKSFLIDQRDTFEYVNNKMKFIEKDVLIEGLQEVLAQIKENDDERNDYE